jgi:hypothetical protein
MVVPVRTRYQRGEQAHHPSDHLTRSR